MGKSIIDKKTNLVKLAKYPLIQGFTVLETLISIICFQLLLYIIIPNLETFTQGQHCKLAVREFEHFIIDAKLRAILINHPLNLMRDVDMKWSLLDLSGQVINSYSSSDEIALRWNGFSKTVLRFEPKLLSNHVNGYFDILCAGKFKYRLWLNRLGHTRLEV